MDADFFSVRRLTLWPRSLTTGTRRVSAPSRLAQRDVAKTWYPANLAASPLGFHSKDAGPGSWPACCRRAQKLLAESLGGRVPDCWDGPIWRKPNSDLVPGKYTRFEGFSQALKGRKVTPKYLQVSSLRVRIRPTTAVSNFKPIVILVASNQPKFRCFFSLKRTIFAITKDLFQMRMGMMM